MSMTEELPAEKPKAKKKAKPRRKVSAVPRAEKPDEIEGINETDCCFDCVAERCCITGVAHCGHPSKGGLQASMMNKPDIVQRYNRARKLLAHMKTEKKG